jgi:Zn-dependent peptidase ImmA (M78 family)/transcriptional regulator with XRE-family HTH domain
MATLRVPVQPELLRWARQRARLDEQDLAERFPRLPAWERQEQRPTLRQLENYARATRAPIGYFFLPDPPEEPLPIPDFRTMGNRELARPSPNLLETIYLCQQRQDWYREHALTTGLSAADFIGSVGEDADVAQTAAAMRQRLGFDLEARRACRTWEEALRSFIAQSDAAGVMVMCSGVVSNNNHRRLDPEEFRGFAIADQLAPLVFINGADTKAAQMFTLAHELAHLWVARTGLSAVEASGQEGSALERWCNRVAAEMLVPLETFSGQIDAHEPLERAMPRLGRHFKVSTLVVLRRFLDAGRLTRDAFWRAYHAEVERLRALPRGSGGDFYLSQGARLSKRFARALVESTLAGQTLYRDAMKLVGVSKVETFNELGRSLHFPA